LGEGDKPAGVSGVRSRGEGLPPAEPQGVVSCETASCADRQASNAKTASSPMVAAASCQCRLLAVESRKCAGTWPGEKT
jgi:hypothetical protein